MTGAAVVAFAIWTHVTYSSTFFLNPVELLTVLAVIAAVWLVYEHRDGFAFAATTVTMASCIMSIFVGLYPNVMVSSTSAANNLTVHNTASGGAALAADRWLFARQDTVEAAWQVVDPVLGDVTPVHPYAKGSWGPEEADRLLPDRDAWHDPTG